MSCVPSPQEHSMWVHAVHLIWREALGPIMYDLMLSARYIYLYRDVFGALQWSPFLYLLDFKDQLKAQLQASRPYFYTFSRRNHTDSELQSETSTLNVRLDKVAHLQCGSDEQAGNRSWLKALPSNESVGGRSSPNWSYWARAVCGARNPESGILLGRKWTFVKRRMWGNTSRLRPEDKTCCRGTWHQEGQADTIMWYCVGVRGAMWGGGGLITCFLAYDSMWAFLVLLWWSENSTHTHTRCDVTSRCVLVAVGTIYIYNKL